MSAPALRVEMRCILFCDIVGSTPAIVRARQEGHEADMQERLSRFSQVWKETLRAGGAEFTKPLGDGLLATFTDPLRALKAVNAAIETMRADMLADAFSVRAGLHAGMVSVQPDGDILGADAALGARVMAEARDGEVFLSEACAALVRPYLPRDYALEPLGPQAVKGFDNPIELYRLRAPALRTAEPAAAPRREGERTSIRLLLVDDENLLRRTLAELLRMQPDFSLVGQAANGAEAVQMARDLRPDVVLMDIQMPVLDGIEATRRIREACPGTEAIILTKFGDDDNLFAALKAGATGYLLKDAGLDEIEPAVRAVHRKDGFFSPGLVGRVAAEFTRIERTQREARTLFADLSRREKEVLELVGTGMRNQAIADRLFISEKTARNHVSNILAKLQVNDRTEAALLARRHGVAQ